MRSKKEILWGLFLLVAAAFVIVGSLGMFGNVSGWTIAFAMVLAAWFVSSLVKLKWGGMLFSAAFAAILFDEALHIEDITPWPVLAAAFLGTIGLNMIFKKNRQKYNVFEEHKYSHVISDEDVEGKKTDSFFCDDQTFKCETVFSTSTKYIDCVSLAHADIENTFGNLTVYFDGAKLCNNHADIKIENTFGSITMYIPKEWQVNINSTKTFGSISESGIRGAKDGNVIELQGSTTFGSVKIVYV